MSFPALPQAVVTLKTDGFLATILVVDDDAAIRRVLRRFLQKNDHDVVEACDGVEALEVLAGRNVDMAIVDLIMPRMNGVELIDRMNSEVPEIGIVVISAYSDLRGLSTTQSNVITVLKKPFELQDLSDTVDLALGQTRSATTS